MAGITLSELLKKMIEMGGHTGVRRMCCMPSMSHMPPHPSGAARLLC